MTGENGVHHGEQRLGEIGKNERNRQQEDSPVPIGHFHDFRIQGFTFLNRLELAADEHFVWDVAWQGLKSVCECRGEKPQVLCVRVRRTADTSAALGSLKSGSLLS